MNPLIICSVHHCYVDLLKKLKCLFRDCFEFSGVDSLVQKCSLSPNSCVAMVMLPKLLKASYAHR